MYYAIYAREKGSAEAELKEAQELSQINDSCPIFGYPTVKDRDDKIWLARDRGWHAFKVPARDFKRLIQWDAPYVDCNSRVWGGEHIYETEIMKRVLKMEVQESQALHAQFPGFMRLGSTISTLELRMVWERIAPEQRILRPSVLGMKDQRCLALVSRVLGHEHVTDTQIESLLTVRVRETGETLRTNLVESRPDTAIRDVPEVEAISPRGLFQRLSETVVGQKVAKRQLAVAAYRHIQNLTTKSDLITPPKNHVLLLGPSGVGKTLLAKSVGKTLNLPFVSTDATDFSPKGYQGGDADECIGDLLVQAQGIVEVAERGVVLIDEVDKLAGNQSGESGGRFSTKTQATLLKLIEGKVVKVPSTLFDAPHEAPPIPVSTTQMLFFLGGAFPGLSQIVGRIGGYGGRKIGLRPDAKDDALAQAVHSHEILISADYDTMVQALIEYGIGAELLGRIPTIAPLAPLTKAELRECLLNVPHAEVRLKTALFQPSGYDLVFDEALIEKIVDMAYSKATGTRALHALVSRVISQAEFDLLGAALGRSREDEYVSGTYGRVILTVDTLADPNAYILAPNKSPLRRADAAPRNISAFA